MATTRKGDLPNIGGAEEETLVTGTEVNQGQPVEEPRTTPEQNAETQYGVLDLEQARGEKVSDADEQVAYLRELGVYANPSTTNE